MAVLLPLRARIGLAFIVIVAAVYGGWQWWMATRTWEPLDIPISLARGHVRSPEFRINLDAGFWMYIEVERKFDVEGVSCLLGYGFDSCGKKNGARPLRASWKLSDAGRVVAQGSTDSYQGMRGGTVTMARGLGDLAVPAGEHYVLDVEFPDDASHFDAGHPRLKIGAPYYLGFEEYEAPIFFLAALLAVVGTMLLASGVAERIKRKREEQKVSLTTPGPVASGFVFEAKASEEEISPGESETPWSLWLGLAFILVGSTGFVAVRHWYNTRTFVPVDMPVSVAAGHIHTGPFSINLRASYWVAIETEYMSEAQHPCLRTQMLRKNWVLRRGGKVVEHYDAARGGWSSFDSVPGVYELDVDVVGDAGCFSAGHPRLRVSTFEHPDYQFFAANLQWLAVICVAAGVMLIVLALLARSREHTAETIRLNLTSHVSQNFQWAQRLPLRRPISGLPAFGLAGGITFGILALVMMLLTAGFHYTPRGMWVHLLKPEQVPQSGDKWAEPILVLLKDEGVGHRPKLYVNSKQINWEDLDHSLKEELGQRREWVVYVGGDDRLAWSNVTDVVDAARKYHAQVCLITSRPENDPY